MLTRGTVIHCTTADLAPRLIGSYIPQPEVRGMNRRTFVTGLGALLAVPAAVGAQTGRRYRVAYVNETVETEEHKPQREAFSSEHVEPRLRRRSESDRRLVLCGQQPERLRALVDEAVGSRPDVLLAF